MYISLRRSESSRTTWWTKYVRVRKDSRTVSERILTAGSMHNKPVAVRSSTTASFKKATLSCHSCFYLLIVHSTVLLRERTHSDQQQEQIHADTDISTTTVLVHSRSIVVAPSIGGYCDVRSSATCLLQSWPRLSHTYYCCTVVVLLLYTQPGNYFDCEKPVNSLSTHRCLFDQEP